MELFIYVFNYATLVVVYLYIFKTLKEVPMFPKTKKPVRRSFLAKTNFLYITLIALLVSNAVFAGSCCPSTDCKSSSLYGYESCSDDTCGSSCSPCCSDDCDDGCCNSSSCYEPCDGNLDCMYDEYLQKQEIDIEVDLAKDGTLNIFENRYEKFSISDVKEYKFSKDGTLLLVKYKNSSKIDIFDLQAKTKVVSFNCTEYCRFVNDSTKKDVIVVFNCDGSRNIYSKEYFEYTQQQESCYCNYMNIILENETLKIKSADGFLLYYNNNIAAFSFIKDSEKGLMIEFVDGSFTFFIPIYQDTYPKIRPFDICKLLQMQP